MILHTVEKGDSVYSISKKYGVPPSRIISDNDLENPGKLVVGQTLVLLFPLRTHIVRGGDTLYSIATEYGVSLSQLWRNNPQLRGGSYLYPGQSITISYDTPPLGSIRTNGYAYPYIDPGILRTTLPYLTYLSIFTYGIREDGSLIPPDPKESELLRLAQEYNVVPLMMLTSLTQDGTFSSELAAQLLSSPELRNIILRNILNTIREKGYGGVDMDFEYIPVQYKTQYVEFLQALHRQLQEEDLVLFVSLAPKTSAEQPGLLYEGHDYRAIGSVADFTLLMTYEWGYTYGPPMAVAPLPEVREVIDYGITEIPKDKIFTGIPNYGYNWTLPYVRGESKAVSLGNVEAVALAREKMAEIQFDSRAQAPFFQYFEKEHGRNAREHIVWFEDARSIDAKLRLIQEYGLRGVGVWNIMRYFPQLWLVLNALYRIEQK